MNRHRTWREVEVERIRNHSTETPLYLDVALDEAEKDGAGGLLWPPCKLWRRRSPRTATRASPRCDQSCTSWGWGSRCSRWNPPPPGSRDEMAAEYREGSSVIDSDGIESLRKPCARQGIATMRIPGAWRRGRGSRGSRGLGAGGGGRIGRIHETRGPLRRFSAVPCH